MFFTLFDTASDEDRQNKYAAEQEGAVEADAAAQKLDADGVCDNVPEAAQKNEIRNSYCAGNGRRVGAEDREGLHRKDLESPRKESSDAHIHTDGNTDHRKSLGKVAQKHLYEQPRLASDKDAALLVLLCYTKQLFVFFAVVFNYVQSAKQL